MLIKYHQSIPFFNSFFSGIVTKRTRFAIAQYGRFVHSVTVSDAGILPLTTTATVRIDTYVPAINVVLVNTSMVLSDFLLNQDHFLTSLAQSLSATYPDAKVGLWRTAGTIPNALLTGRRRLLQSDGYVEILIGHSTRTIKGFGGNENKALSLLLLKLVLLFMSSLL